MKSLSAQQTKILAATVKEAFWLFDVDFGSTGTIDHRWSHQPKTWGGHNYVFRILSFTPLTLTMGNPELGIIPPNKITVSASFSGHTVDGPDLSPDDTALSDNRTEADSTTGLTAYGSPDTFASVSSGSPYLGDYHIHVVSTASGYEGFSVDGFSLDVGITYRLRVWYKVTSGTLWVLESDGVDNYSIQSGLTAGDYTLLDITFVAQGTSTQILFITQNVSGEFYIDNMSLVLPDTKYASDFKGASITARLICGATIDGSEMTPDDTAVSDTQTEANSITGWTAFSTPDVLESVSTGSPSTGTYHIHTSTVGSVGGFVLNNISFVAGKKYTLSFDCKLTSGNGVVVQVDDGDGGNLELENYTNAGYESKEIEFTSLVSGGSGRVIFYVGAAGGEFYVDNVSLKSTNNATEDELMTWRFLVTSSSSVDQVLTLDCQDWFTSYLEGDYPNTPLVSDLFPADIMKADNICVPVPFGLPFIPLRWIKNDITAIFIDADTLTVVGDQTALFSVGQFFLANLGVDGIKVCEVLNSAYTTLTTVNLTADSGTLTANLTSVTTDHYLLGPSANTYTINRARSPIEAPGKSTFDPGDYTFKQDIIGSYKVVQLLCHDANKDGTNDSNGFWGVLGKEMFDVPFRFSRDDLVSVTNPADIAQSIFEDWGIPSGEIDSVSQAAAAAIFTARSFELNVGLFYQMPRKKLISKLFTISGMIPVIRDTIGFKVLTKVSQATITEDLVKPGSFQISPGFTQQQKDCGYVTWQSVTEPVDQVNKSLVSVKSSTDSYSNTTIECEWVSGSAEAQKAGKLALQRILLKDKRITFIAQGKILALEPGDMITIDPTNLGAEAASYDCLIVKMTINAGLSVKVECIKFSDDLDDWGDLSISALTVGEAETSRGFTAVFQGPKDSKDFAGGRTNEINQSVVIIGGADLTFDGSDTDPGIIIFQGTDHSVVIGGNASGSDFIIAPNEDNAVSFFIGGSVWQPSEYWFEYMAISAAVNFQVITGRGAPHTENKLTFEVDEDLNRFSMQIYTHSTTDTIRYEFLDSVFRPELTHKEIDLGAAGIAWDDVYADDYNNVADFLFLDIREEDGEIVTIDDLETIKAIKPGGKFDPRTGFELIDDDTLPDWLLSKDKKTGEILRDPEGKPYLSLKTMISLLMGAVRQLDKNKKDKG